MAHRSLWLCWGSFYLWLHLGLLSTWLQHWLLGLWLHMYPPTGEREQSRPDVSQIWCLIIFSTNNFKGLHLCYRYDIANLQRNMQSYTKSFTVPSYPLVSKPKVTVARKNFLWYNKWGVPALTCTPKSSTQAGLSKHGQCDSSVHRWSLEMTESYFTGYEKFSNNDI